MQGHFAADPPSGVPGRSAPTSKLTPRRRASGDVDWTGRISRCGDAMVRTDLSEASALHTLIRQPPPTPSCGGLGPYRGENSEPSRHSMESLTANPRVREQPGPTQDVVCIANLKAQASWRPFSSAHFVHSASPAFPAALSLRRPTPPCRGRLLPCGTGGPGWPAAHRVPAPPGGHRRRPARWSRARRSHRWREPI